MTEEKKKRIYSDWGSYRDSVLDQFEKESKIPRSERPTGRYIDEFFRYLHFRMCRYLMELEIAEEQRKERGDD